MGSRKQAILLEPESERSDLIRVPLENLHPDPANLRGPVVEDDDLRDLAGSIASAGLISPLTVRVRPDGGYFLVAGHRRAVACKLAGLDIVPAVLRTLSDDQVTEIMLSENTLRERLEPRQEAEGYRLLLASGKYTVQGLAGRLKIRPQRIWEKLHFLEDGPELTEAVTSGRLPASVADVVRATAKALHTTPCTLLESMADDLGDEWTARQVREWCRGRRKAAEDRERSEAERQALRDKERQEAIAREGAVTAARVAWVEDCDKRLAALSLASWDLLVVDLVRMRCEDASFREDLLDFLTRNMWNTTVPLEPALMGGRCAIRARRSLGIPLNFGLGQGVQPGSPAEVDPTAGQTFSGERPPENETGPACVESSQTTPGPVAAS